MLALTPTGCLENRRSGRETRMWPSSHQTHRRQDGHRPTRGEASGRRITGRSASHRGRPTMFAHVGDRIVVEGTHLGDNRRVGIITAVGHTDGAPPYQVRWLDNGHTTLIYPGAEARIEPPAPAAADRA